MSACVYTHTNKRTGEVFYVGVSHEGGKRPHDFSYTARARKWGQYVDEKLAKDTSRIEVSVTPVPNRGEAYRLERALIRQYAPVANTNYNEGGPLPGGPEFTITLFGSPVHCTGAPLMVSLNDVARAGNRWRILNSRSIISVCQVLARKEFIKYRDYLSQKLPGVELIVSGGQGGSSWTRGHINLAVFMASMYGEEFNYEMIETFAKLLGESIGRSGLTKES